MSLKKKILVIDDDLFIRELLSAKINQLGYDVHTSDDAMKAMQYLQTNKPDLILLDVMLPGLSGLELLNLLSVEYDTRKIPVIIISKMGEERIIETARQLGAEDYLVKPFTPELLIEKISAALN